MNAPRAMRMTGTATSPTRAMARTTAGCDPRTRAVAHHTATPAAKTAIVVANASASTVANSGA